MKDELINSIINKCSKYMLPFELNIIIYTNIYIICRDFKLSSLKIMSDLFFFMINLFCAYINYMLKFENTYYLLLFAESLDDFLYN